MIAQVVPGSTAKFSGTRPMSPQHAVDVGRLAAYLRAHVDGLSGELAVSQFKGGQSNPTFLLEAGRHKHVTWPHASAEIEPRQSEPRP